MKKILIITILVFPLVASAKIDAVPVETVNPITQELSIKQVPELPQEGLKNILIEKSLPHVGFDKWNGEVSLGIQPVDALSYSQDARISSITSWTKGTKTMRAYQNGDNFEIDIVLNSKPSSNIFDFTLDNWANLDFFYQAPLWQESGLKSPTTDCTDTDCRVFGGRKHRPDNVIGSYAVYYKDHANHIEGQTNYGTGKAFHIYRPLVTDAVGSTTWAKLSYESGTLSVIVPQLFLDNASYPLTIDPTFGYTTQGASIATPIGFAGFFTAPANGTITSISFYNSNTTGGNVNAGYWSGTGAGGFTSNIAHGSDQAAVIGLNTVNVSGSITSGTSYWLNAQTSNTTNVSIENYDSSSNPADWQTDDNTNPFDTWTSAANGCHDGGCNNALVIVSIYATYTTSGAAVSIPRMMITSKMFLNAPMKIQ